MSSNRMLRFIPFIIMSAIQYVMQYSLSSYMYIRTHIYTQTMPLFYIKHFSKNLFYFIKKFKINFNQVYRKFIQYCFEIPFILN
jgi:hypothetical protein